MRREQIRTAQLQAPVQQELTKRIEKLLALDRARESAAGQREPEEVQRMRSHLLQALRFLVSNNFLQDLKTKPLVFPADGAGPSPLPGIEAQLAEIEEPKKECIRH